jgi:hypothetical protein
VKRQQKGLALPEPFNLQRLQARWGVLKARKARKKQLRRLLFNNIVEGQCRTLVRAAHFSPLCVCPGWVRAERFSLEAAWPLLSPLMSFSRRYPVPVLIVSGSVIALLPA